MLPDDRSKAIWIFLGIIAFSAALTMASYFLSVNHGSALMADLRTIGPEKTGQGKGFLWKVTSNTTVAYLFGSYHDGNPDLYPLTAPVEDAFRRSGALVTEINPTDAGEKAVTDFYNQRGYYPEGDSLERHLSALDAARYRDFVHEYRPGKSNYLRFRPWRAVRLLENAIFQHLNLSLDYGADHYFRRLAKGINMPIQGAETELSHAEMSAQQPDSVELSLLHYLLNYPNWMAESFRASFQVWVRGDEKELLRTHELVLRSKTRSDFDRQLLEGRNPHLTDVVERYLRGKTEVFVVYGVLHFIGPDSVVDLLRKRGYTVEQIPL